ncbi:MAG TPA: right-handed parallel beta-helix repeat-containing protein [Agriterribacter sp.]|nr:right-handed parallel beta-helix repeat-containing protein [Agriterribacter sp.]
MYLRFFIFIIILGNSFQTAAREITIKSPGSYHNIQGLIQQAVDSADDGDVIILPEGEFAINETVLITKFISIKGQGILKTILYWNKPIQQTGQRGWGELTIFNFRINNTKPSGIKVSGIFFKGVETTLRPGDGKNFVRLSGINMMKCVGFIIEHCRFEYFGYAGVSVFHQDTLANGLIRKNEFYHNAMRGLGYGVLVYGESKKWVDDAKFGSSNFIFVEDNVFNFHRHSIASGGGSLFVFRHNYVVDNIVHPGGHAVDTHEAREPDNSTNSVGSRACEVYDNLFINRKDIDGRDIDKPDALTPILEDAAIAIRSGEAVVYNNRARGYNYCIKISNWYLEGTEQDYPIIQGPGYLSGKKFGTNHTGDKFPESDGDVFLWNNKVSTTLNGKWNIISFKNVEPAWWKEGRDYHFKPKPEYKPYPYPYR